MPKDLPAAGRTSGVQALVPDFRDSRVAEVETRGPDCRGFIKKEVVRFFMSG